MCVNVNKSDAQIRKTKCQSNCRFGKKEKKPLCKLLKCMQIGKLLTYKKITQEKLQAKLTFVLSWFFPVHRNTIVLDNFFYFYKNLIVAFLFCFS